MLLETSTRTSQPSSSVSRRPDFHVRLSVVFAFNLLLFVACLVGVTSYLFLSLQARIAANVDSLVLQSMMRYEGFLVQELTNVETVSQQLAYRLVSSGHPLRIRDVAQSTTLTVPQRVVYSVFSSAVYRIPSAIYVYENTIIPEGTGYVTLEEDGTTWVEQGCGRSLCYRVLSNSTYRQMYFTPPPHGQLAPEEFPLYNVEFDDAVVASATYVEFLHSLNQSNITAGGSWSLPSVWVDAPVPGAWIASRVILLSYVQCLSVNATTAQCDDAVSVDIKLRELLEQLFTSSGERKGEKFALFHTASMRLLSSTLATTNVNTTATNCTSLGGCSFPLTTMYFATNTPFPTVNYVLSDLLSACGATPTVIHLPSGKEELVLESYAVPESCSATVKIYDGSLVAGMHRIRVGAELDFLLLTLNDIAELQGGVMQALASSVIAVVVVSVVVSVTVAYVFVSVSQGVKNLTSRFAQAEAMNFEAAMVGQSISASSSGSFTGSSNGSSRGWFRGACFLLVPLAEVARLEDAFARLSGKLLKTRAFLPQQLLNNDKFVSAKQLLSRKLPQTPTLRREATATFATRDGGGGFDFALFSPEEQSADPPQSLSVVPENDGNGTAYPVSSPIKITTTTAGTTPVDSQPPGHAVSRRPHPPSLSPVSLAAARVTVMWINLGSFHGKFRQMRPPAAQQEHAVVIAMILDAVRSHSGVVDFFHGDHFMVSFNASASCRQHGLQCAEAAVQIIRAQRYVRVGLSTGTAFCGVLGCDALRRFCIVGPVVDHAFVLTRHCKVEQLTNLMSQATFEMIHTEFIAEHRGRVWLKTVDQNVMKDSMISTIRKKREYALAPTTTATRGNANGDAVGSSPLRSSAPQLSPITSISSGTAASSATPEVIAIARREHQYDVLNEAFVLAERGDVLGSRNVLKANSDIPESMTQRLVARWAAIENSQPLPVCV